MKKLLFKYITILIVFFISYVLILVPKYPVYANNSIQKSPKFAEKIGYFTGIVAPTLFGLTGISILTKTSTDIQSREITVVMSALFPQFGLLIPPLGNVYSGHLNTAVTILYMGGNISYLTALISWFSEGLTANPPNVVEGSFIVVGVISRFAAGILDWITAPECAIRANQKNNIKSKKANLSFYIKTTKNKFVIILQY